MAGWFSCPESPGCHPGLLGHTHNTAQTVPGFHPGLLGSARRSPKKPPAVAGGLRVACLRGSHALLVRSGESRTLVRHGWRDGFPARSPRVATRGFLGARVTPTRDTLPPCSQKAPGGSRGTPGGTRARMPCHACPNRRIACGPSCMDGGKAFMPGVPGLPPGASWAHTQHGTNRPGLPPGASWAHASLPHGTPCRPVPKKPPAAAGGLRVAHRPGSHSLRVRSGESRTLVRHGWRDGFPAPLTPSAAGWPPPRRGAPWAAESRPPPPGSSVPRRSPRTAP